MELQVAGVKADMSQLPSETKLSFTIHSLIVVDALQSYGKDFDLLVASHRNVRLVRTLCWLLFTNAAISNIFVGYLLGLITVHSCIHAFRLDSKSGSICSSSIASPVSPHSPRSPSSPPEWSQGHMAVKKQKSYTSFQNAVVSSIQKLLPVATGELDLATLSCDRICLILLTSATKRSSKLVQEHVLHAVYEVDVDSISLNCQGKELV